MIQSGGGGKRCMCVKLHFRRVWRLSPRLLSKSTYTFLEQVKKLSKSMECVWWDCKSEKHQTESAGVWSDEHLSLLLLSFPFILLLKPKNYRAKKCISLLALDFAITSFLSNNRIELTFKLALISSYLVNKIHSMDQ